MYKVCLQRYSGCLRGRAIKYRRNKICVESLCRVQGGGGPLRQRPLRRAGALQADNSSLRRCGPCCVRREGPELHTPHRS